ncbi:hypothetical protein HPB50_004335 [Hyalomma asiaticum]|uniref:Uncharacterized protein n=1 Tax=Hyalomma asiaticum TaxID=266040 RepID=A0ACB7SN35_HYAAI|nr:hypothetical protein HPB50_004335 [Hyalomma asiaticum]
MASTLPLTPLLPPLSQLAPMLPRIVAAGSGSPVVRVTPFVSPVTPVVIGDLEEPAGKALIPGRPMHHHPGCLVGRRLFQSDGTRFFLGLSKWTCSGCGLEVGFQAAGPRWWDARGPGVAVMMWRGGGVPCWRNSCCIGGVLCRQYCGCGDAAGG